MFIKDGICIRRLQLPYRTTTMITTPPNAIATWANLPLGKALLFFLQRAARPRPWVVTCLAVCLVGVGAAQAAPVLRTQVTQHGDFVQIGNTLAYDCVGGMPAPVVGMVGACGDNTSDSAPDIYWSADEPAVGQAQANTSITPAQARSTAMLTLPAGAHVTHAYLYWAANSTAANKGAQATIERPSVFSQPVVALQTLVSDMNEAYRSVADITSLVQTNGAGAYRVGGIDVSPLENVNDSNLFAGWWMVVLYELPTAPLRNLAVFDGLDMVERGLPQKVSLTGFQVPSSAFDAKLGVVALEGDTLIAGDQLFFNGGTALSNTVSPAASSNNFFSGSRSYLGTPQSVVGDLPQTRGTPGSMSGIDLHVVDVSDKLAQGATSATIQATSTGDVYYLASFVTSITTYRPSFTASTMAVNNLNGGAPLPGNTLQYTVNVSNTGNEDATQLVMTDPLPAGVSYVPGSLAIASGDNAGPKTDAAGDDQAEYSAATRKITVRLGAGATAAAGGTLATSGATTITFNVTVDALCSGDLDIANQATLTTVGASSHETVTAVTDGDMTTGGAQPTMASVSVRSLAFAPAHPLGTVSTSPAGAACGAPGAMSFPKATPITLTANPNPGAAFSQWTGACTATASNICVLTLNADDGVGANFVANAYVISTVASPVVGGSVSCTPTAVTHGATSVCTAMPTAGYTVQNMQGGSSCSAPASTMGVNSYTTGPVTGACTVTASFSPVQRFSGTTVPGAGGTPGPATASFTGGGTSCRFDNASTAFVAAPATLPAGQALPQGMLQFKLVGCDTTPVTMSINWPQAIEGLAKWGKASAGATASSYFAPSGVSVSGNTTTFTVQDGQKGDDDWLVNGEIIDPVGATVPAAVAEPTPVPTLHHLALLLLSLIAAAMGGMALGRKQTR